MYTPIYCIIHSNRNSGLLKVLGISKDMNLLRNIIKEDSRNYKEEIFRWEDFTVYVSDDGIVKYIIQIITDFDKKI